MRNSKALTMIVVSVIMGLAAVILASQWLGRQAMATRKVVVAARDIPLGSPLGGEMLKVVDWPSSSLPEGAFDDPKTVDARVVKTTLQRGEAVLEGKLAPIGTKGGLSSVIGEGKRAISVRVNEVIGVAGFALPGNLVDVMVNTKDSSEKPISKIVLEKILVLAVAQEANRDETKPKVVSAVTLELTPAQAEKLDLARSVGTLSLVLRNQLDKNMAATDGARTADLLRVAATSTDVKAAKPPRSKGPARAKTPPDAPPAPPKHSIEVIKGVQKSSTQVDS